MQQPHTAAGSYRRASAKRTQGSKEGNVGARFIGYTLSFVVLAGTGVGLPLWFEWRRSLLRSAGERKEAVHV